MTKTLRYSLLLLLVPLTIGLSSNLSSCSKEPMYKDFLIQVDRIEVDIVSIFSETFTGEMIEIDLYGLISHNGCAYFSHFNTTIKDNNLIIEAWKTVNVQATVCPDVMVFLEHHISIKRNELPDSFIIKVKEPDGSFLTKAINNP